MLYPSELPGYPVAVRATIYTLETPGSYGQDARSLFATHSRASAEQLLTALRRVGSYARLRSGPEPGLGNFWPRWATVPVRALVAGRSLLWGWSPDGARARGMGDALAGLGLSYQGRRITSANFR